TEISSEAVNCSRSAHGIPRVGFDPEEVSGRGRWHWNRIFVLVIERAAAGSSFAALTGFSEELFSLRQILVIVAGAERGVKLWFDFRAIDVERLIEVHDERDGSAADERETDIFPVGLGRVFDDGPTLQKWRIFVAEDEAIAGFPNRGLLNVANADR